MEHNNSSEFFRTLNLLFYSLLVGQVFIFVVVYWFMSGTQPTEDKDLLAGKALLAISIFVLLFF
jgi:hypothetical protein